MHVAETTVQIVVIILDLGRIVVTVPDGLLLVWDCCHPLRSQVVIEKLKFVLVLFVIFVDGKTEADWLKSNIVADSLIRYVVIQVCLTLELSEGKIAETSANTLKALIANILIDEVLCQFFAINISNGSFETLGQSQHLGFSNKAD